MKLEKYYRHKSKGWLVECITRAKHEQTGERLVIYRRLSGARRPITAEPEVDFLWRFIPTKSILPGDTAARLNVSLLGGDDAE